MSWTRKICSSQFVNRVSLRVVLKTLKHDLWSKHENVTSAFGLICGNDEVFFADFLGGMEFCH